MKSRENCLIQGKFEGNIVFRTSFRSRIYKKFQRVLKKKTVFFVGQCYRNLTTPSSRENTIRRGSANKHRYQFVKIYKQGFPHCENSIRRDFRTAKVPFGEISVRRKSRTAKTPTAKNLTAKSLKMKITSDRFTTHRDFVGSFAVRNFPGIELQYKTKPESFSRFEPSASHFLEVFFLL